MEDGSRHYLTMRYRIFRPRQLHMTPPPLVVLHGGPGVPSNYLVPLVNVITDRAIILYDQLGSGLSARPADRCCYSIQLAVTDLHALVTKAWKIEKFHLYGQSFGGILAFEYLKSYGGCLSVTLSSTTTETKLAASEIDKMLAENGAATDKARALEIFRQKHECRVVPMPLPLQDAYAQASVIYRGMGAIRDYKAACSTPIACPALVLRGQHDFVTQQCIDGWSDLLSQSQTVVLGGCSHHGLLEREQMYGDVILSFLRKHDT